MLQKQNSLMKCIIKHVCYERRVFKIVNDDMVYF